MYKKRLKKWGFIKSKKTPQPAATDPTANEGFSRFSTTTVALPRTPSLNDSDAASLAFMTKVRDWTISYFQTASVSSNCAHSFEVAHYGIKLSAKLLSRGHGVFAGQMARKAFLQLEDVLYLDGPAMVWNLTELIYNVAVEKQAQLLQILLDYLLGIARKRYPRTHPLIHILLSLSKEASSSPSKKIPLMLTQAAVLNAELTLVEYFHPHYSSMYQTLLWDNCSIRYPGRVRSRTQPTLQKKEVPPTVPERLAQHSMSNDDSIRELSQLDFDDPSISQFVLPARTRSMLAPTRAEEPSGKVPKIHAQIAACMNDMVAESYAKQIYTKQGAYEELVKRLRLSISLREYSTGANDPHVVWVMLLLEDVMIRTKRFVEAAEVEREYVKRLSRYLGDVPKDGI
jgi:HEPN domain-containing protein